MSQGSNWYRDADVLLDAVRLTSQVRGALPSIAGYDDLIEIKRGGQGVVYAATQKSTKRRVAIKVLLEGTFASPSSRRRFEREIDLVAGLRHPNIVSIFDSGVTPEGWPYYVMEYVEGAALDEYIAARLTSTTKPDARTGQAGRRFQSSDIVRLVADVCDAVQFAHQHGVIHRDLKPANIRVDSHDRPRVLDFGLAKLVTERGNGSSAGGGAEMAHTALTVSGQFAGSVPWASPEQVRGELGAIDTRTDVYALGVILYQLLTGRFPYDVSSGLRDAMNNILTAEPTRLSIANRAADADLETIVHKCLAKEPERRYQSVGAVGEDLRRFVAGEPIQARRDSAWYTLRKTARRYQLALAAATVVLLAVVAGLATSVAFWQQADEQRREADEQRGLAEQKSRQAQAVTDFLTKMLDSPDPAVSGRDVRVADLLDAAAARVQADFGAEPETEFAVRKALGRSYFALSLFAEAETQFVAGEALARRLHGPDSVETLGAQTNMGLLWHVTGRHDESESLLRQTIESLQRLVGDDHKETLHCRAQLSDLVRSRGRPLECIEIDRELLERQRRVLGEDHRNTLMTQNRLATCLRMSGKLDEAEAALKRTLDARRRVMGPEHQDTITSMSELASLYSERKQIDLAEPLLEEAARLAPAVCGEDHPVTLAVQTNYAILHMNRGRPADAEPLLRSLLARSRRKFGDDHSSTITDMANLGSALRQQRKLDDAEPLYREAHERSGRVLGPQHPTTLTLGSNLGLLLMGYRKYAEAEALFREALEAALQTLSPDNWAIGNYQNNVGRALFGQQKYEEAEPFLLDGYAGFLRGLGPQHPWVFESADDLVKLYEAWGRTDEAEKWRAASKRSEASPP